LPRGGNPQESLVEKAATACDLPEQQRDQELDRPKLDQPKESALRQLTPGPMGQPIIKPHSLAQSTRSPATADAMVDHRASAEAEVLATELAANKFMGWGAMAAGVNISRLPL
jgi:hypothetical protein